MFGTRKVALVGTGFMAMAHLDALRRLGIRDLSILGSTQIKGQAFAKAHRLEHVYERFADLLADPALSVVHILTPNRSHYTMCRALLEAGKHVLCEKPLAMNTAESTELVRVVASLPELHAGVNYNIRYYPLCAEVRESLLPHSPKIYHIQGSYLQDWLLDRTDYNWRVLAEEGGPLRAVVDIGTHWLDLVQWMTGQNVVEVMADLQTVHPVRLRPQGEVQTFQSSANSSTELVEVPIRTEDAGHILLRFSNGAKGALSVSQVTAGRKNQLRFEIACDGESFAWQSEDPNSLWVGNRHGPSQAWVRDPAAMHSAAEKLCRYPSGHAEGYPDTFTACFGDFYTAIERQVDPANRTYPTFADGHREIGICEAILQSHQQQRWIPVSH